MEGKLGKEEEQIFFFIIKAKERIRESMKTKARKRKRKGNKKEDRGGEGDKTGGSFLKVLSHFVLLCHEIKKFGHPFSPLGKAREKKIVTLN